jgi:hypothetical protein
VYAMACHTQTDSAQCNAPGRQRCARPATARQAGNGAPGRPSARACRLARALKGPNDSGGRSPQGVSG